MNLKSLIKHTVDLGHGISVDDLARTPSIKAFDFTRAEMQSALDELVQTGQIVYKKTHGNYWPADRQARENAWQDVAKAARGHVSSEEAAKIIEALQRTK